MQWGGLTLLYTGNPFAAGAVGGLSGNLTTQGLKMWTGKQCEFDYGSAIADTGIGALTGFIPAARTIRGVNAGRGSDLQVFRQMVTKGWRGQFGNMRPQTAVRMARGAFWQFAVGRGLRPELSDLHFMVGQQLFGKTKMQTKTQIRSVASTYAILVIPWLLLAAGYVVLSLKYNRPGTGGVAIFLVFVALLWCVWLRGFRIEIDGDGLEYRNGFYQKFRLPFTDMKSVSYRWTTASYLPKRIKLPRMILQSRYSNSSLMINPKPFGREEFELIRQRVTELVRTSAPSVGEKQLE